MLKLLVRDLDIYRISKLLAINKLKATITDSSITIDSDEIADEIIDSIFENAVIISAQNYQSIDTDTSMETKTEREENLSNENPLQLNNEIIESETIDSEYYEQNITEVIEPNEIEKSIEKHFNNFSKFRMLQRGDVYKWKKDSSDEEGRIKEFVIIIQNDYQMSASEDTIALFCTSHFEERAPIRFSFRITPETMKEYEAERVGFYGHCTVFVGHIKGIKRKELGAYLGTMNNSFMNTLQPTIDFCLGLKRSRTVNMAQLKMLATIDMEDLFRISELKISNQEKITEYLKLFNFDLNKKGMNYVKEAIYVATMIGDYRLEDLADIITSGTSVKAEEVLRLIIARIKEKFGFKKSPAISFIRLIDRLIKKG